MTHASLFSGIGGFGPVARRGGWADALYRAADPFFRPGF